MFFLNQLFFLLMLFAVLMHLHINYLPLHFRQVTGVCTRFCLTLLGFLSDLLIFLPILLSLFFSLSRDLYINLVMKFVHVFYYVLYNSFYNFWYETLANRLQLVQNTAADKHPDTQPHHTCPVFFTMAPSRMKNLFKTFIVCFKCYKWLCSVLFKCELKFLSNRALRSAGQHLLEDPYEDEVKNMGIVL